MADGRAVMRSSVREFIASEAMHHLGIPTTRALSLVGTGDKVLRDMFYKCAPLSTHALKSIPKPLKAAAGLYPVTWHKIPVYCMDLVADPTLCSGNAKYEPGAVVCRVSPSFVRFGTFQLPAMRGGDQLPLVRTLADYVIRHLYPHLEGELPIHLPHLSRMNTLGSHNTFIHASSHCWDSSQRCRDLRPIEAPGLKPMCCAVQGRQTSMQSC